jgi:hypothetical protein
VSNCHFASSANFLLALHTFIDFFSPVKKADHEIVIHPLTTLMPRTQLPRRHTARRRGAASGSRPSLPGAMDMRTVVLEASSHDAAKQFWGQRRAVSFTIGMLIGTDSCGASRRVDDGVVLGALLDLQCGADVMVRELSPPTTPCG